MVSDNELHRYMAENIVKLQQENKELKARLVKTKRVPKYPIIDGKKFCPICEKSRAASQFHPKKVGEVELRPNCKRCLNWYNTSFMLSKWEQNIAIDFEE